MTRKGQKVIVPLNEEDIESIRPKDKTLSTVINIGVPVLVGVIFAFSVVKSVEDQIFFYSFRQICWQSIRLDDCSSNQNLENSKS